MANINEKIYIGSVDTPTLSFNQNNIEDIVCNNSVDLIGDELSSDTLEVSVFFDDVDEVLRNTEYGTPIFYYSNDYLVGKYYVSEIERKSIKRYLIRATSLIGLIEKENFYGGFYSGETFENVLNDILFSNGVNLTRYYLYVPIGVSNGSIMPAKVSYREPTSEWQRYRMYLDFTIVGTNAELTPGGAGTFAYVAGMRSDYYLRLAAYKNQAGYTYWNISMSATGVSVGVSVSDALMLGNGTRIVIDCNPVNRKIKFSVDYVRADNQSITGHIDQEYNLNNPVSTNPVNLTYAYGACSSDGTPYSSSNARLIWNEWKVYDENGIPVVDALYATNSDGTKKYVVNKVDNIITETTSFIPYGNSLGVVSDFTRIERDLELSSSIMYGDGIRNIPVYGWIGVCARREALHQLLFSENVYLLKSSDGEFLFVRLSNNTSGNINEEDIYDDSKEKSMTVAKTISVTEHNFENNDETAKIIFDNSSMPLISGQYIVLFDNAPIQGTPVGNGIDILFHNCNAAVVTGRGTITGVPYFHAKNIIEYNNAELFDGSDIKVANVSLINRINSDNVMNKLKAYYSGSTKKISNSLKFNGQRCGSKYAFKTLYNNNNSAFLSKMALNTSSFVKARCEFVSGYVNPDGSGYTNYEIITYGETWVVPDEVKAQEYPTIRFNIIGKGHSGTNGGNGSAGESAISSSGVVTGGGAGGSGGSAGIGGDGGDIYSVTVDATNVKTVVVSNSGYSTIVKTYNNNGSILNTYYSQSGNKSDKGFVNIFTGIYYAKKGIDGHAGGAGGKGGSSSRNGTEIVVVNPEPGEDVEEYLGGQSFNVEIHSTSTPEEGTVYYYSSYGGGGGATYGNNGNNATRDYQSGAIVYTTGGNGANALVPQNPNLEYGSGGFGGNGGGGGGGAGTYVRYTTPTEGYFSYSQQPGVGGLGSSGTSGINGCVIIYY